MEVHRDFQKKTQFHKETRFNKPTTFNNRFQGNRGFKNCQSDTKFKPKNMSNDSYAEQMEGIDKS